MNRTIKERLDCFYAQTGEFSAREFDYYISELLPKMLQKDSRAIIITERTAAGFKDRVTVIYDRGYGIKVLIDNILKWSYPCNSGIRLFLSEKKRCKSIDIQVIMRYNVIEYTDFNYSFL